MTETRRGGDGGGIRVAAVGHRDSADDGLAAAVRRVLATILGPDVDAQDVPHAVRGIIISSLAEGADRLLAREGLALPGVELHAVLPLPPADYCLDFATEASRVEFDTLLARAASVEVLAAPGSRNAAYANAGRKLVDRCDIVVAIWDGKPARGAGGTADVVAYARERGRPLCWIHSEDPARVVRERLDAETR